MAIVKFNPFSPWFTDQLYQNIDDDSWPQLKTTDGLDVYETDTDIIVKAAVPGIPADKVEVTFEDGVLRIKAQNDETIEQKDKKIVHKAQRSTSFDYTTTFPRPINSNQISAEVENGVITLKAPIAQEAKTKRITVRTKSK